MWCSCVGGGRRGFKKIDGELWGCENCSKPTRAVFNKLTAMRAPRGATALLSMHGRRDGINQITFAKQGGERETVLEVAGKPTVLERLWIELDTTMDALMELAMAEKSDEKADLLRIRARAQAETLAILMDPFFTTADEIAREAKRRYDARRKGDEGYTTPGLAGEEYVPPAPPVYKSDKSGPSTPSSSSRRSSKGKSLPPGAIASIKEGIEKGMFTVPQIAKSYGVTEQTVKDQTGLA